MGGSPVYYVEGQEEALQARLCSYMKEDEKSAFELLKENIVLKDVDQTESVRKGLKALKDFAKPLNVKTNGNSLLFWKWYIANDVDVKSSINELLNKKVEKKVEPEIKSEEVPVKKIEKPEIIKQETLEVPKVVEESVAEQIPEVKRVPKPISEETDDVDISYSSDDISIAFQPSTSLQGSLSKDISTKLEEPVDEFYSQAKSFLDKLHIEIVEANLIKKDSEVDLILDLPTPIGVARYYCKAKNKKRLSDGDLSTAFVQGQIRRLPVILLSPGELSKKALDMITNELKGQILFKCMNQEV